jgi:hypothetical protein
VAFRLPQTAGASAPSAPAFLTPEMCKRWRMGYLPRRDAGGDHAGGTMRGKIVYPMLSESVGPGEDSRDRQTAQPPLVSHAAFLGKQPGKR